MSNTWSGRPILHPKDAHKLDAEAALAEFRDGLTQQEAEELAYSSYKKTKLVEAAAHHLRGMRGALAVGDKRAAQKHAALYQLAHQSLGLDPIGPTHESVLQYMDATPGKYRFASHKADILTDKTLLKSEQYITNLSKILELLG